MSDELRRINCAALEQREYPFPTGVLGTVTERHGERTEQGLAIRYGNLVRRWLADDAHPPQAVRASFDDVNAAQQEMSRLENEAQREYNKIIQVALGEAKREVSEAEGYAADRVNRARGDIARYNEILQVYQASKEVTRRRLYLETIEKVLPKVKEVIVVSEEGVLKHLPLGKGGAR